MNHNDELESNTKILGLRGMLVGPASYELFPTPSTSQEETKATPQTMETAQRFSAILETAFLVAAADGKLTENELEKLEGIILQVTEGNIPESDIKNQIKSYNDLLDTQGYETRFRHIANILKTPTEREAALVMALGILRIDGRVLQEQTQVYQEIAQTFSFSKEQIIALLNKIDVSLQSTPNKTQP